MFMTYCSSARQLMQLRTDRFYRAMLCISTVFAWCLSVTFMHSIQTAEDIIKLLCRPGSPIILFFLPPARVPNSKGNPFSWGTKYKGWENFAIFDWNRFISRKRYEIYPWLPWNVNRKSYELYRLLTFPMTLTVIVGLQGHGIFEVEYLKNKKTLGLKTLKGNYNQSIEYYHFQWFNDLDWLLQCDFR